jgi:Domain of unknown function DUF29
MMNPLYDQDLSLWCEEQGKLLRAGKLDQADIENLAEEIESLGRNEHFLLDIRIWKLLELLLKWVYQPERRCPSWYSAIVDKRMMIDVVLGVSPSLRALLPEAMTEGFRNARLLAEIEIGKGILPTECPWTFEQMMTLPVIPND